MKNFLDGITRPGRGSRSCGNPVPHSPLGFQNRARVQVVGPDERGNIVTKQTVEQVGNILTTFGLASLASRVGTASGANANTTTEFVSAMKIGTGTTAATSNDTALVASTGSVTIGNASFTKTNVANRTVEYQATFASNNPAGAATITEIGCYLNSTADSQIMNRLVLTGAQSVNKGASDVINVSLDIVFTTA
jgi:hypothetical protein